MAKTKEKVIKEDPIQKLSKLITPEIAQAQKLHAGRPRSDNPQPVPYAMKLDPELVELFKDWAWTERLSIRDAGEKMFREYLADKEILTGRPRKPKRTHRKGNEYD